VKTGVQGIYKLLKRLDSGFRRNDGKPHFQTFYEIINFRALYFSFSFCYLIFSSVFSVLSVVNIFYA